MIIAHIIPCNPEFNVTDFFTLRILVSLAAPIFLFLVGYNFNSQNASFSKLLLKVIVVFILALIVDVFVWGSFPFYSFDILYTIGFSMIILYLLKDFSIILLTSIIIIVLILGFFYLQLDFYPVQVNEPSIKSYNEVHVGELFKNLFFDGWFPLIPWILFSLLGQIVYRFKLVINNFKWLIIIVPILLLLIWVSSKQPNFMRNQSIEMFYPANTIYLFCAITFLFCIWIIINRIKWYKFNFIAKMGRVSLFLYVFHLFILHSTFQVIYPALKKQMFVTFVLYFIFFAIVSYCLNFIKNSKLFPKESKFLGILLGK
jgi:uncharacterized membrane protein